MGEMLVGWLGSEAVANGLYFTVLCLSLVCPLFNIFISGLEEAMQCALIPFAGGKCLRAGLLFLGRLEERINRNPAEFSKDKWQALPRGGRAPGQAGTAWLGSSSAENAAVGSELSMCVNVHQHLHCSSNRPLPMELFS